MVWNVNRRKLLRRVELGRERPKIQWAGAKSMTIKWKMCHAPSWLDPGELSHMHIHLTMDHDSTQLNAPPRVGNAEYSLTWTSPTSTDISGQAGMAHCKQDNTGRAAPKSQL